MTRWSRHAVAVILIASMVMAAVPAQVGASSGTLVIGSQHTDFGTGGEPSPVTQTNLTVSGSGDSATISLDSVLSQGSYNVVDDSGDGTAETDRYMIGDNSAGAFDTEWQVVPSHTGTVDNISLGISDTVGSDYGLTVDVYAIQERPDATAAEGQLIAENWNPTWSTGTQTIDLDSEWQVDSGETWTLAFVASGSDGDGSDDVLKLGTDENSGLNGWATDLNNNAQSWGGDITLNVTQRPSSAKYVSAPHAINEPQRAVIDFAQLSNVSVTATVRTAGGTVLGQATVSSAGEHTIPLSETSSEQLETVLDIDVTGANPQFELADESILFHNSAPTVDNSSASPSGGKAPSTDEVTLSIGVTDEQFGTAQGDELTVEWYINGTKVDTTTGVTTNGTVSTTINDVGGGDKQWHAVITDSYGASTTSQTFDFRIPNKLAIRNVSAPSTLITGASVKLTFYSDNDVITREDTDNDGYIELTGLDPSERFIVVVEADNYYKRTVILDDIFTQNSVYLLNKSKPANEVRFTIDDPTGIFSDGDAEIFIKKALTRDFDNDSVDETRVVRIAGDEQGVNGFTTFLEDGARYRIEVRNKDGDTRLLGAYTADSAQTVTLQPGSLVIQFDDESQWNATAYRRNTTGQPELVFEFADAANNTTDLEVAIWEQGNRSNQPENWNNVSLAGPFGTYQASPTLTANETNTIWVVNFTAQRGGEQINGQFVVGPQIQQQLGGVAPWLLEAVAMVTVILTGALFSKANAGVGGVTTALVGGGFWYAGFLSAETGGGILLFLAIALAYKFKGDMV